MANIIKVEYLCWFYNACDISLPKVSCTWWWIKWLLLSIRECRDTEQHGLSRWGIVGHSLKVWEVYAASPSTAIFWSETEVLLLLRMNCRRTSGLKVSRRQLLRDLPWQTVYFSMHCSFCSPNICFYDLLNSCRPAEVRVVQWGGSTAAGGFEN